MALYNNPALLISIHNRIWEWNVWKKLFSFSFKRRNLRKEFVCLPLIIIHDLFEKEEISGPPFWLLQWHSIYLHAHRILHKSTKGRANTFAVVSTFYFIELLTKVPIWSKFSVSITGFSRGNLKKRKEKRGPCVCIYIFKQKREWILEFKFYIV